VRAAEFARQAKPHGFSGKGSLQKAFAFAEQTFHTICIAGRPAEIMGDSDDFRIEKDSMGEVRVPSDVLYGAQTQRAVENFPISGLRFPREFIRAIGLIKQMAARANLDLGLLQETTAGAIVTAAQEVVEGKLDRHFVLDIFQTGSGTSTNMNANEVIANRAIQILGGTIGSKKPVHPNDHVNLCQSSNDVIPAAMHIAVLESITQSLIPALKDLQDVLSAKAEEFDTVIKTGRTHLQDATPIRLGQEFGGYTRQVELAIARLRKLNDELCELALGGTAVGTGINTHPDFASRAIRYLAISTGLPFREAINHVEAQSARDAIVETSGVLKTVAVSLTKIANDIRWLASGPRCAIGEITIPETQQGSSIMPGKVNPVIAESLVMAAAQVVGNDATIAIGGMSGNFELNVMMPVIAHNVLESIRLLAASARNFAQKCVAGISANIERCNEMIEKSLAMCTALVPEIGYDAAAGIARESYTTGKTVREIASERGILSPERLNELLDPGRMTRPGIAGKGE
jgi:fumarate hydratase class II